MRSAVPVVVLPLLVLLLAAAGPVQRGLSLQVPSNPDLPVPPTPPAAAPQQGSATGFRPAPLPNRDIDGPTGPRASGTSVGPSLFTRGDSYRGEGFGKGSSAQTDQERRARPGAGFSLKMPLTPD